MEIKAFQKNAKISPKKTRFLLDSIRSMTPEQAVDALYYMPHKSAKILRAVIKSALANATNTLKIDSHLLQFKSLSVDQGNKLKRFRAGGRGTAKPYVHELSHIAVILETKKSAPQKQSTAATSKGEEAAKEPEQKDMKAAEPKTPAKTVKKSAPKATVTKEVKQ